MKKTKCKNLYFNKHIWLILKRERLSKRKFAEKCRDELFDLLSVEKHTYYQEEKIEAVLLRICLKVKP